MLELKKVSKYYYNKGVITSGFSKVNLKFEMGEFVAITGESGSGKSTLLNVISGLDSYEDGEMYINGEETSYYTEKDYENYRKKYIGNIFQTFNLVNSYTVFQNIELVYLLKGYKKREVKSKVIDLINKVGLSKYKNRKVSRLSGGQKQRVAIARALAEDTPIILADEPTGNLDKESSKKVLKILHEVSKDKLVIVVTHNYDQIEEYVTRKITMHDGKVIEDKHIRDYKEVKAKYDYKNNKTTLINKIIIGIRNAFNVLPKFLLITAVYIFICFALFFIYEVFEQESRESDEVYNGIFQDPTGNRIVINKLDRSEITIDDYEKISKLDNVSSIVKNDYLIDNKPYISSNDYYFEGMALDYKELDSVDYGRIPEEEYEVAIYINPEKEFYYFDIDDEFIQKILDKNYEMYELYDDKYEPIKLKIVGIKISDNDDFNTRIYYSSKIIERLTVHYNSVLNKYKYTFLDSTIELYLSGNKDDMLLPSKYVKEGTVVISDEYNYSCKKMNCKNYNFNINIKNIYSEKNISLKVANTYMDYNINKLTGYDKKNYGKFFISEKDYEKIMNGTNYQSSIFVKNSKNINKTEIELNKLGFNTLVIKDNSIKYNDSTIIKILEISKTVVTLIAIFALFFISYFIIKLILKSRNVYYSTLRILGSTYKCTRELLEIELLTLATSTYLVFCLFLHFIKINVIKSDVLYELYECVLPSHYIALAVILFFMSLLIAERFSRKLFVHSVMNTYNEEV